MGCSNKFCKNKPSTSKNVTYVSENISECSAIFEISAPQRNRLLESALTIYNCQKLNELKPPKWLFMIISNFAHVEINYRNSILYYKNATKSQITCLKNEKYELTTHLFNKSMSKVNNAGKHSKLD